MALKPTPYMLVPTRPGEEEQKAYFPHPKPCGLLSNLLNKLSGRLAVFVLGLVSLFVLFRGLLSSINYNAEQVPLSQPEPHPPFELSPPHLVPNDCKKTLLIRLGNNSGFFSEMGIFARFAARGRDKGYTILVDDSYWNSGKMTDYFDYEEPACAKDPSMVNIHREEYCQGDQLVENPHMAVDRGCYELYDEVLDSELHPEAARDQDVWSFLNMKTGPATLPFGQTLHPKLKDEFVRQSNELRAIWKPNRKIQEIVSEMDRHLRPSLQYSGGTGGARRGKVISIHYRLGDKKGEYLVDRHGSQNLGINPSFGQPNRYVQKALAMAGLHQWKLSPEDTKIVVASDDLPKAMESMGEYQDLFPDPPPFQLLPLNDTSSPPLLGHNQWLYDHQLADLRRIEALSCVAQVEWIRRNSDAIICSAISNVCMGLMLLAGVDRVLHRKDRPCSIASIDGRWTAMAIPSRKAIDVNDKSFIKLAKALVTNPDNIIDFNLLPF